MSIHEPSATRTAIWTMPDKEWMEKKVTIVFEIPGEMHRKIMDARTTQMDRHELLSQVYLKYAVKSILEAQNHPRMAGFEVLNRDASDMMPCDIQEDAEDILIRTMAKTHKDVPREKRYRAILRDTVFWQIDVWAKQQRYMHNTYRETRGPRDGFEAIENLPEALRPSEDKGY